MDSMAQMLGLLTERLSGGCNSATGFSCNLQVFAVQFFLLVLCIFIFIRPSRRPLGLHLGMVVGLSHLGPSLLLDLK